MQLDEFKTVWAAHGAALERSLAIDERLLREVMLRKVRWALAPYAFWRALEVVLGVAVTSAVVPVLAAHAAEPRYLVVAGALAVFSVGMTAMCAYLLVGSLRLDYGGTVTSIQRDVERLQLVEYRAFKWALLGGVVMWLPAPMVLLEALSGVAFLARVDLAWLAANLLVGLALLAIGQAWSKRYVERADLSPWARRLVEALSGRALRSITEHLAELKQFEREETPSA